MRPGRLSVVVALALAIGGVGRPVCAQEEDSESWAVKPEYWAVTGVSSNDVLNVRDVPSADSRSLGSIPPNANHVKNLGCRRTGLSFERWMKLSKAERQAAEMLWCRVEYKGLQGWVAGRYLTEEATVKR